MTAVSVSPDKIVDARLKQLEMLQTIVTRLSNQSASLKNYCITIVMASAGLAITANRPVAVLLGYVAIFAFALLDAKYLQAERCFRAIFSSVSAEIWDELPKFDFDWRKRPIKPYFRTCLSWSILGFYGSLAIGITLLILFHGGSDVWLVWS